MATGNPFRGLSEAELLAIKAEALEQVTKGSVMVSGGAAGKSMGRQVTMGPEERLKYAMQELRRLDPDTYGTIATRTSGIIGGQP